MANATTSAKGTRLCYHATKTTLMSAQVAGASLPSGWVQVLNVQNVDPTKNVIESYDDGDLEDAVEVPAQIVKPGKITFDRKKSSDTTSQSLTLQALCDGSTRYAWAIVYPDGTVCQTSVTTNKEGGRLVSSSGGKASNGDLKSKAMESYEIQGLAELRWIEHA